MATNDIPASILDAVQERWREQIDSQIADALLGPHSVGVVKASMVGQGVEFRRIPYSRMVDFTS